MASRDDRSIDPRDAEEILERGFASRTSNEVVARAMSLAPAPKTLTEDGLGLAQMVCEVSWRMMLSLEQPDRVPPLEAIGFARNVCEHLDEAAALVSQNEGATDCTSHHLGIQARRMLVSQGSQVKQILEALVQSQRYQSVRTAIQQFTDSVGSPPEAKLEEIREFFATFSMMLEEASS